MPVLRGLVAISLLATMAFVLVACGDDEPEPTATPVTAAQPGTGAAPAEFTVTSEVIEEGGQIPEKYTCDGDDLSPDLRWNTPPTAPAPS